MNNIRENKGNSLLELPDNYTVIDIETTGLDSSLDNILEISAIKVRNNTIIDSFSSLVHYAEELPEFITELTGITNDMVKDAPILDMVLNNFYNFIGNDILIGHNVNFDINFLYDSLKNNANKYLSNDFVDTLRLSRKVIKELDHHRLSDLLSYYKIDNSNQHRALADCNYTFEIYNNLKKDIYALYGSFEDFTSSIKRTRKAYDLTVTVDYIDEDNYFYGKNVVFTGTLQKMPRVEAQQTVVNLGGTVSDNVNKKTNCLVMGTQDYSKIKSEKSNKQRKAEEYILKGQDIVILTENVFYDILNEINNN